MKEITVIIRRDKLPETKHALDELGYPSLTIQSVDGRGKQKGDTCMEIVDPEMPDSMCTSVKLTPTPSSYAVEHTLPKLALFIPKRMLTLIAPDEAVTTIVDTIIKTNRTGRRGDGKIFVSPVEDALRVRTGEVGCDAVK